MPLVKLSETTYSLDENNTLTVKVDNCTILKISEVEILSLASKIIQNQTLEEKLYIAHDIFHSMLKKLEVPEKAISDIQSKSTSKQQELIDYIYSFLNKKKPSDEFGLDEFNTIGNFTIKQVKEMLKEKFNVEQITTTSVKITIKDPDENQ